ncbi:glycosyltransferase family 4 protein [Paludisphaera rhizosphaerae]|uniref:glycosyltransferase family 4 protein n=1 Tax=Paludisphaera rhizosphaerae TaxID=2711216 RepID=UPI0019826D61|nr:glycosyltransferase family 4 protein [Paludisphaera rhizosphaerae]
MTQEGGAYAMAGDGVTAEGPRILIVAEHASAQFGGEAILPLHIFRRLRRRGFDVRLVVHGRSRRELEALFPDDLDRLHFISDSLTHYVLYRLGIWLPDRISYFSTGHLSRLLTALAARRLARRLVQEHKIDVVHQPIPVSPREPSMLYDLGAPVVIGPMNGAMSYPPAFQSRQSAFVTAYLSFGRFVSGILNRVMPGKLKADVLLVANERTRDALPSGTRGSVQTMIENGVDLAVWSPPETPPPSGGPLQAVFVGRLIDCKAVDLLLESFRNLVSTTPARLVVAGDGRLRSRLERQAAEMGLADVVKFVGWLTQEDCAELLRRSDVLILPSLHECGGAVVLEAMATALPVVVADWGGPADYVDETCGVLVPPTSREEFIAGLTSALDRLARSPELRRQLGRAGRDRILREYDWDEKIDRLLEVYEPLVRARRVWSRS